MFELMELVRTRRSFVVKTGNSHVREFLSACVEYGLGWGGPGTPVSEKALRFLERHAYGDDLAIGWSEDHLEFCSAEWYRRNWGCKVFDVSEISYGDEHLQVEDDEIINVLGGLI